MRQRHPDVSQSISRGELDHLELSAPRRRLPCLAAMFSLALVTIACALIGPSLADRVVFLEGGLVREEGAPQAMESIVRYTENVFTGSSRVERGVSEVDVGEVVIRVSLPVEGRVSLHVRPEDIIAVGCGD